MSWNKLFKFYSWINFGGYTPSNTNPIEFITIATTGNAADFGDKTNSVKHITMGAASSRARGCLEEVTRSLNAVNVIEYVEISTLGNAVDFGDTD